MNPGCAEFACGVLADRETNSHSDVGFYGSCSAVFSRRTFAGERTVTARGEPEHLDVVARAVAAFEAAREALEDAVGTALDHGATWSEIGGLLGISRQAAFHRYGPKEARRGQPEGDE
jgi:hypothetical protein